MKWIVPLDRLDPQQRDFVNGVDIDQKNYWISGFPGSGKSVLLVHSVGKIRRKHPQASIAIALFTRSLVEMYKDAFKNLNQRSIDIDTHYKICESQCHYDYILCDEVQDFTDDLLQQLLNKADHLIVAGDENQSIYQEDPRYHQPTVKPDGIKSIVNASEFKLNIIHRLSKSIISAINAFMPDLHIFSAKNDMTKKSTQIRLCEADNFREEVEYIMKEAQKAVNVRESCAVLVPSAAKAIEFANMVLKIEGHHEWKTSMNAYGKIDFGSLNSHLDNCQVKLQYVGSGYGSFSKTDKVVIMTYHSSKGLDFDNVFLFGLDSSFQLNSDSNLAKTIFMVGMTRSRNNLYLTYYGRPHEYLGSFSSGCNKINIHSQLSGNSTTDNLDFHF